MLIQQIYPTEQVRPLNLLFSLSTNSVLDSHSQITNTTCLSIVFDAKFIQYSNLSYDFLLGELMTTSIRPTVMYGEEDHLFFPILATWANRFGGVMPRIFGAGGKTQITYVGMYENTLHLN